VSVAEGVDRAARGRAGQGGSANYDVSRNGTLVYTQRGSDYVTVPRRLLAVDMAGNAQPLIDDQRDYWRPRISKDGTRVAVEVLQSGGFSHLWIVDLQRRTATPLSTDDESGYVGWTPDGGSVIYEKRLTNLYQQVADGSRAAQALLKAPEGLVALMDVSRRGMVAYSSGSPAGIRTLDLASGAIESFPVTSARESMARFSPDGEWLAYTSREFGRDAVYVRAFPRTDGIARLVSTDGGSGPVWAPNGKTLYYRGTSGDIMAVPVTLGASFAAGRPARLFRFAGIYRMSGTATAYDIHPDGQRFIMVSETDDQAEVSPPQQVQVVLNFQEELKQRVPPR
jgi:Tol biopolymer transport system component